LWGKDEQIVKRSVGRGAIYQSDTIAGILEEQNILPDFSYTCDSSDPAVNYIHRVVDGDDVYFIANRKRRSENLVCSFRVTDKAPEYWDPDSGQITPVSIFENKEHSTHIPIQLPPSGSTFIVFR